MASDTEDEELKRAIALSLGEEPPKVVLSVRSREPIVIDDSDEEGGVPVNASINVDGDEEDEELQKVLALSREEFEASQREAGSASGKDGDTGLADDDVNPKETNEVGGDSKNTKDEKHEEPAPQIQPQLSMGLPGMDRAAMERERLARLAKRKRGPDAEQPLKYVAKESQSSSQESSQTRLPASQPTFGARIKKESSESLFVPEGVNPDLKDHAYPIQFPYGTIKRTWAFKHPRTDDIKLEEVLQANTCTTAVLSSFDWDDTWLFSKLSPIKTKQIWVMNAKGEDVQAELMKQAREANTPVSIHFPDMSGQISSMHCKFMLLFHPIHLRIAIPTANFMYVDWGETVKNPRTGEIWQGACMENSVFIVDLPRRADGKVGAVEEMTAFGKEVLYFMTKLELDEKVLEGLKKFDYSDTEQLSLVHSMGGTWANAASHRTGLPGLSKTIQKLGLQNPQSLELDYCASSIGNLNQGFLAQLYHAASGAPHQAIRSAPPPKHLLQKIRVYFPLHDTVVNSTGGIDCGGTNTLTRKFYEAPSFPREVMRDYQSTRPGLLSHNKLLFARGRDAEGQPFAWVYVGSANLSKAAWGEVRADGRVMCRNWEVGVLVRVDVEEDRWVGEGVPGMGVFEGMVEVPFKFPGDEYGGRKPWFMANNLG